MSHHQEILPVAFRNKTESDPFVKQALGHYTEARKATIQVMADLRLLQDRDVHMLYGYTNFGRWAEDTFQGLAVGAVRQLCRAGAVALELDRRGLIDLKNPKGVGTTGLRELSVISKQHGDDRMAEVYVLAHGMLRGKDEVTNITVQAAMRTLLPPKVEPEMNLDGPTEDDLKAEYEDEPATEKASKELELIEHIRDLTYDLPESLQELREAVEGLALERAQASVNKDQTWIDGVRDE